MISMFATTCVLVIIAISSFACHGFVPHQEAIRIRHLKEMPTLMAVKQNTLLDFLSPLKNDPSSFGKKSRESDLLIEKAKDILYNKSGFYSAYDPEVFSDEFVFRGPYIGPLNKRDYLQTMESFGIYKAIPDINPNAWGFSIDPENPNRVWFMVRNTGTFDGEPIAPKSINYKPNGAQLKGCPETFSMLFDKDLKLKYLSVGYVADRFEGNTNGKGAAVGIFNAVGLPFPKVGPLQRLAQWFGTEVFCVGPMSYSVKDVPEWWTDKNVGSGGYL